MEPPTKKSKVEGKLLTQSDSLVKPVRSEIYTQFYAKWDTR